MELSPDEVRLIERTRASKAIKGRPISNDDVVPQVISAIIAMSKIIFTVDPTGSLWDTIANQVKKDA